jgi:predicted transcriptional regulator
MLRMAHITPTAEQVAAQVSKQIAESGVTVVWLCEKTGIPRSTLLRRLGGHSPFDLNELDRIAEALRVPPSALMAVEPAARAAS